jgi:sugar O-acyltransferase (sialic acid O-acetyltransferase NeuD family)
MHRVLILGAGGHAQVVADILLRARDAGQPVTPIGYLDDNASLHGKVFLDLPVLGHIMALDRVPHDAIIIAVGNNQIRKRLADEFSAAGETFAGAHHPAATIAPDVLIGPGAMICAGVVINTGSAIGAHVILNTGCTVDHHNDIESYAHIAPGVHTGGEVIIAEGALIGIGATIAPRTSVGAWATVGAGAVVTKPVPPGVTVVGVPARPLQRS